MNSTPTGVEASRFDSLYYLFLIRIVTFFLIFFLRLFNWKQGKLLYSWTREVQFLGRYNKLDLIVLRERLPSILTRIMTNTLPKPMVMNTSRCRYTFICLQTDKLPRLAC